MLKHRVLFPVLLLGLTLGLASCAQVHDRWIFVSPFPPSELAKGASTIVDEKPVECIVSAPDGTVSHKSVVLKGAHPMFDADWNEVIRVYQAYQAEHQPAK